MKTKKGTIYRFAREPDLGTGKFKGNLRIARLCALASSIDCPNLSLSDFGRGATVQPDFVRVGVSNDIRESDGLRV
jgi:hypothetical protein